MHSQRGAASVMHPTECRKFSIAELRRLCSFPDDYKAVGDYQQQAERFGRAVPPLAMKAIAESVAMALQGDDK
jgi:DNA (cytosine-5)-methyltransferase 1